MCVVLLSKSKLLDKWYVFPLIERKKEDNMKDKRIITAIKPVALFYVVFAAIDFFQESSTPSFFVKRWKGERERKLNKDVMNLIPLTRPNWLEYIFPPTFSLAEIAQYLLLISFN